MSEKVSVEVLRRVFDDKEGVFLEIGPDGDGLGCVEIRTTTDASRDWWGPVRISLGKEFAAKLAEALAAAAKEAE
jgi:hypothetical protein